jgi:hypothetical protein
LEVPSRVCSLKAGFGTDLYSHRSRNELDGKHLGLIFSEDPVQIFLSGVVDRKNDSGNFPTPACL